MLKRTAEVCALIVAMGAVAIAEEPPRRAKPPAWPRDVLDAFFDDARQELAGQRPASGSTGALALAADPQDSSPPAGEGVGEFAWSELVDVETLAAEVKRVVARLGESLVNPATFKAGGFNQCREEFAELAVLFAVIADHDGDARWKSEAPALRDALARASRNCKTATDLSFNEAVQRKAELDDIVRGQRLPGVEAQALDKWSELADRALLMKRMERAFQENISPQLASEKTFEKALPELRHEAELLAVLADVIRREDFDYWDDEAFQGHAQELRGAAHDLTRAAIEENYDAARQAAGRAGQACTVCHEGYRG